MILTPLQMTQKEEEKSTSVKSDDPVRMYLKEMGNVEFVP
ncbi:MAG: hypothetical protein CM15mP70_06940 [Pelagibacteraceae bacterium]|nr:MAG: hypothetical protein CM15mP70_06940 [Pelagibacteraceae bacterium]